MVPGVFEPQVDVSLWSGRPAGEDGPSPPMEVRTPGNQLPETEVRSDPARLGPG